MKILMQGLSVRDADVPVRNTIKAFQIVFKGFHFGLVFMRHNTKMCQLNSANVRNCHAVLYSRQHVVFIRMAK